MTSSEPSQVCSQGFFELLQKLQTARKGASGKTLAQDLVRTFMIGLPSIFPCVSVRIFFGGWHYEHFFGNKDLNLPPLNPTTNPLVDYVYREQEEFVYSTNQSQNEFEEQLEQYLLKGISLIQMYPFTDVNGMPLGFVEVTSHEVEIPKTQILLLKQLVFQLGVLLETSQSSVQIASKTKRTPSPELITRLQEYEEELHRLSEKLEENVRQEKDRESIFYSLVRYFRDTIRMIEAWEDLQKLTPESEIERYDFQNHSKKYVKQAFRFSELLLQIYRLQRNTNNSNISISKCSDLIHRGIEEFTSFHPTERLNLKTTFPPNIPSMYAEPFLFEKAIVYILEYMNLAIVDEDQPTYLSIDITPQKEIIQIDFQIEQDPAFAQLQANQFDFQKYMQKPLDEYGMYSLYLPFVNLAISSQGGNISIDHDSPNTFPSVTIEMARAKGETQ